MNYQGVLGLVRSMERELPSYKKYKFVYHHHHHHHRQYQDANLIVREKVRIVGISPLFVNTELVGSVSVSSLSLSLLLIVSIFFVITFKLIIASSLKLVYQLNQI